MFQNFGSYLLYVSAVLKRLFDSSFFEPAIFLKELHCIFLTVPKFENFLWDNEIIFPCCKNLDCQVTFHNALSRFVNPHHGRD